MLPTVPIKQVIRAKHIPNPTTMLTTAVHRSPIAETQKGIVLSHWNYICASYSGVFAHAKPDATMLEYQGICSYFLFIWHMKIISLVTANFNTVGLRFWKIPNHDSKSCAFSAPKKTTNDLFSKLLNIERMCDVRVGDSIDLVEIQASWEKALKEE